METAAVVETAVVATAAAGAEAAVSHVAEQSGTYYVRIVPTDPDAIAGFVGYSLSADTSGGVETPNDTSTLVIIGGSPENKVPYEFTYEGDIERSGESHGAPIAGRHVTVDPDVDEIAGSRVNGRLGRGGDAYLIAGEITGFNLDGDADVYLNGQEVDPGSFGNLPQEETTTATPTATQTPAPTATETPTPTETSSPTQTANMPSTATPLPVTSATETITEGRDNLTAVSGTENDGEILGGTDTETNSSGPGFSLAAALIALLVAVSLLHRYR